MLLTMIEVDSFERALRPAIFLAQQYGIDEVLRYINVSVENNSLIIRANSPDSYYSSTLDVKYNENKVSFNIDYVVANALLESIKNIETIDLSIKPNKKTGKVDYLVATVFSKKISFIIMEDTNLLQLSFFDIEADSEVPVAFLLEGLKSGLTSTVKAGDPRHSLYSVALKLNNTSLIYSTNTQVVGSTEEAIGFSKDMDVLLLSVPNVKNVLKFMETCVVDEYLKIGINDDATKVIFTTLNDKLSIVSSLLQGEYINISSFLMPKKESKEIDNHQFQYILQKAKLFVLRDFPFVKVVIKERFINVTVEKSKVGKFSDSIEITDGTPYTRDATFYLDVNFLITILKNITDFKLFFGFNNQEDKSVMLSGEKYRAYMAKIDENFLPNTIN